MQCFARDDNNDLFISGRSLAIVSDLQAVLQVCEHAAKTILGEMVLAKDQGMPYFETVWVGGPTTAPFEAAFRARIAQVEGVTAVQSLTAELVDNTMRYSAEIATIYGSGVING